MTGVYLIVPETASVIKNLDECLKNNPLILCIDIKEFCRAYKIKESSFYEIVTYMYSHDYVILCDTETANNLGIDSRPGFIYFVKNKYRYLKNEASIYDGRIPTYGWVKEDW